MAAQNMSYDQFHDLTKESKPVLVDFWAPWCSYCRRIGPAYDKVAEQYGDNIIVGKVNIDEEPRLAIQEMIFGNQIDDNGVLVRTASDKPGYFAVGFKSEKADGSYRYVWLYKVRAKPTTENYATKEGTTVTRQTGEVEWTAIKRTHDGRYQAVADEGQNGFTADKGATFLTSVYEPTFAAAT